MSSIHFVNCDTNCETDTVVSIMYNNNNDNKEISLGCLSSYDSGDLKEFLFMSQWYMTSKNLTP